MWLNERAPSGAPGAALPLGRRAAPLPPRPRPPSKPGRAGRGGRVPVPAREPDASPGAASGVPGPRRQATRSLRSRGLKDLGLPPPHSPARSSCRRRRHRRSRAPGAAPSDRTTPRARAGAAAAPGLSSPPRARRIPPPRRPAGRAWTAGWGLPRRPQSTLGVPYCSGRGSCGAGPVFFVFFFKSDSRLGWACSSSHFGFCSCNGVGDLEPHGKLTLRL